VKLPPLITWSDVRWVLFVVAGLGFLAGLLNLVLWAGTTLSFVWAGVVLLATAAIIVALIGRELWAFWMRYRR
jgi:hypothetical protein